MASISMLSAKEYILFCDESDGRGRYYSNFYGGALVSSSEYQRIRELLRDTKQRLNFYGEVKWAKVSATYLDKYIRLIQVFFDEIRAGNVRVRIMFRQNAREPVGLTKEQTDDAYFRLYYQFIKHAFGLEFAPPFSNPVQLRIYFDEFPATKEQASRFKGYILGLRHNSRIKRNGFRLLPENITEIRSHEHDIAQCLDIILGAMAFRLNDKHKEKSPETGKRGKKTAAKLELYEEILRQIRGIRPNFNIGISTGTSSSQERWLAAYQHWSFIPSNHVYQSDRTKRAAPSKPT